MRVKIHSEGYDLLILMFLFLVALNGLIWYVAPRVVFYISLGCSGLLYFLLVNFFRCPKRVFEGDITNTVVCPADGKIVVNEEVYEHHCLNRRCRMISIFMSPFNVHANWYPVEGRVKYITHHEGRYKAAYLPKASWENEPSTIVIETPMGQSILVRQVAGAMARRVITYSDCGDKCHINEFLGFIKFGSRVDLYLPLDTEVLVKMGDKVVGNITKLAILSGEKTDNHKKKNDKKKSTQPAHIS